MLPYRPGHEPECISPWVLDEIRIAQLSHVPHSRAGTYSFFASSLLGDPAECGLLVSVAERVTNMSCVQGRDLTTPLERMGIMYRIARRHRRRVLSPPLEP